MTREHFTLRLNADTKRELERLAAGRRVGKTVLAEQYLEEAVRLAAHPGVLFRDGPAGRRPALVSGPDVWEVVSVFRDNDTDEGQTASYLNLPVGVVQAAIGYYADHREDIDSWIEANNREADEAEAAWQRRRALGST
ncbi:MAG TPA: CopG family transcriptional regulator [Candidatus Dormibacteraeota bacterium]